jgi:hypothetical protein
MYQNIRRGFVNGTMSSAVLNSICVTARTATKNIASVSSKKYA